VTDLTGVEDRPDASTWFDLSPASQAVFVTVAKHDGAGWRGLVAQKSQQLRETSERHTRRALSDLEERGLIVSQGPNKRRETFAVTASGQAILDGLSDVIVDAREEVED